MNKKVRVGVVGTSDFADAMHLAPLASHPGAELVAICGRNRARAEQLAAKYGIPSVHSDWRTLAASQEIDALAVVTPDDLHYPITMLALEAGKHVFCEKALAMNAAQAREMYETAERKGLVHMTLFTFRWAPVVQYMRERIEQGALGRVYHAHFSYLLSLGRNHHYSWRADPRHSNGMLADLGSHLIDIARLMCGEVHRVAARADMYMEHSGPDGAAMPQNNDSAVCLLEFINGAQATFQVSSVAHLGEEIQIIEAQVFGEQGGLALRLPYLGQASLSGALGPGRPFEPLAVPERLNVSFLESPVGERLFIDSILSGGKPEPSFYDGWKAQQVIDAALRASQSGQWEAVSD